jgi:hypothetical protein
MCLVVWSEITFFFLNIGEIVDHLCLNFFHNWSSPLALQSQYFLSTSPESSNQNTVHCIYHPIRTLYIVYIIQSEHCTLYISSNQNTVHCIYHLIRTLYIVYIIQSEHCTLYISSNQNTVHCIYHPIRTLYIDSCIYHLIRTLHIVYVIQSEHCTLYILNTMSWLHVFQNGYSKLLWLKG